MTSRVLRPAAVVLLAVWLPFDALARDEHEAKHTRTPQAIVADLKAGNARFVGGRATHPNATPKRVKATASGQAPEAVILGCSDSRVPPEIVFDEGIGDLFVVRVAGNVSEEHTIGSVEYAAEHLGVPLVVVLGHHGCGAVKAAVEAKAPVEGNVGALVREIEPSVVEARRASPPSQGGVLHDSVHLNAQRQADVLLRKSPVLKHLVDSGKLTIVPAVYDLDTGKVEWPN